MQNTLISPKLFSAISWLLLIGSLYALAYTGLGLYQRHIVPPSPQTFSFSDVTKAKNDTSASLVQVINRHIFGVVPVVKKQPKKVETVKVVEAPKTRLNLKLAGVVALPGTDISMAMIEIKRGETSVVRIGDAIGKTGAVLEEVFADHILIEHRGKIEKLTIERKILELSDPNDRSAKTISALNINPEELAALSQPQVELPTQQQIIQPQIVQPLQPQGVSQNHQNQTVNNGVGNNIPNLQPEIISPYPTAEDDQLTPSELLELEEIERMEQAESQGQLL